MIASDNPDPAAIALPTGGYIVVTTHGTWSSDDAFKIYFSSDLRSEVKIIIIISYYKMYIYTFTSTDI